jgi:hypothetical protein
MGGAAGSAASGSAPPRPGPGGGGFGFALGSWLTRFVFGRFGPAVCERGEEKARSLGREKGWEEEGGHKSRGR